ncbi:MAG: tetratricopeptide repeat protein [Hyphomonadaceae bacterium]|nr:tetratricopeptide repeat protein [Hyphomonadaceae bacterium]
MEVRGRQVALYGRFSPGARERLAGEIARLGGLSARDFTRRSHILVVGAAAARLIDGGQLVTRLKDARLRRKQVFGERRFAALLRGEAEAPCAMYPLAKLEGLERDALEILAAFDIIRIEHDECRFIDVATLRTAAEIIEAGRSLGDVVRILAAARDLAPKGRRKIVIGPTGEAALQWEQGLTTLEGQFLLPLDTEAGSLDDLFEAAALAEAEENFEEAARLYDMCARADRKDAIAPFNLGNMKLALNACEEAVMAYRTALARDAGFVEAHYNLALVYERMKKPDRAAAELQQVLALDPAHLDALFNLAQLDLQRGDLKAAKARYEDYLAGDPPPDWAAKARKAIMYCTAQLARTA